MKGRVDEAVAVPAEAGRGDAELPSPSHNLYTVGGLPYGTHTLKITVRPDSSGTGHNTDIDGFVVSG